jgi:hypothetical protein
MADRPTIIDGAADAGTTDRMLSVAAAAKPFFKDAILEFSIWERWRDPNPTTGEPRHSVADRLRRDLFFEPAKEAHAAVQFSNFDPFVGLMRLVDVARAADNGRTASCLKVTRFRAVGDGESAVLAGEFQGHVPGRRIFPAVEGRDAAADDGFDGAVGMHGAHGGQEDALGIRLQLGRKAPRVVPRHGAHTPRKRTLWRQDIVGNPTFDVADGDGQVGWVEAHVVRQGRKPRLHPLQLGHELGRDKDRPDAGLWA